MQIFIQAKGEAHAVNISEETSIEELRKIISSKIFGGIPDSTMSLFCEGVPLLTGSLATNGIYSASNLIVAFQLPGGKVHGGLALTGKVKKQTPKVEKQEKQKPKTGRSKRRDQYKRRFLTQVVPGARRRGPNSNAP